MQAGLLHFEEKIYTEGANASGCFHSESGRGIRTGRQSHIAHQIDVN